jgi:carbon storage regulator CsrA
VTVTVTVTATVTVRSTEKKGRTILVLKRKSNQSVRVVGPDGRTLAVVTVVGVDGKDAVRLAFSAPPEVKIVRSELTERPRAGEGWPS